VGEGRRENIGQGRLERVVTRACTGGCRYRAERSVVGGKLNGMGGNVDSMGADSSGVAEGTKKERNATGACAEIQKRSRASDLG